jgi:hypothetical protein
MLNLIDDNSDDSMATLIRLEPGESYECIYKMQSTQFNTAHDENEISVSKNFKEVEQFADFSVSWLSASTSPPDTPSVKVKPVHFTLKLPPLTLVDIPLKVTI